MTTSNQKTPTINVFTIDDFQKWLSESHKKEDRVAVIIHKKHTGKSAPTHRELVEEAICYGWIDTTIKRFDDDRFIRNFSKRTKNSSWSKNTLSYAQKLIKEGRMKEQGLHFYELGLKKKTHDHDFHRNSIEMSLRILSNTFKVNDRMRKIP